MCHDVEENTKRTNDNLIIQNDTELKYSALKYLCDNVKFCT